MLRGHGDQARRFHGSATRSAQQPVRWVLLLASFCRRGNGGPAKLNLSRITQFGSGEAKTLEFQLAGWSPPSTPPPACQALQRGQSGQGSRGASLPHHTPLPFLDSSPAPAPRHCPVIRIPQHENCSHHEPHNYSQALSLLLVLVNSSSSPWRGRHYYLANFTSRETEAQEG